MTADDEIDKKLEREISESILVGEVERALARKPRRESVLRTFPIQGGPYTVKATDPIVVRDGIAYPPSPGETPTGFVFGMDEDGHNVTVMMPCPEGEELDGGF